MKKDGRREEEGIKRIKTINFKYQILITVK